MRLASDRTALVTGGGAGFGLATARLLREHGARVALAAAADDCIAELAPDGVTANCVCPNGCPTTEMGRALASWKARIGASLGSIPTT